MHRTGFHAFAAADALRAVGVFMRVNVHLTNSLADAAVNALIVIKSDSDETDTLKQGVKRAERADIFAKRPVYQHG